MPAARLDPLPGSAALVLRPPGARARPILILADLHLGLGGGASGFAVPPEGSPGLLRDRLLADADRAGARTVLIAGDVKHPIVGTPPALRRTVFDFFGDLLVDGLRVEVVLGNHDVGLVPHLPKEVEVHPPGGVVRHGVGIFHGHAWPSEEVRRQDRLVMGHLHPGFRFAPTAREPEAKRRCWVRSRYPPNVPAPAGPGRRSKEDRGFRATESIVLPAFHPLAGTEPLNRGRPSRGRSFLFARFLALGRSRLYLLDGTDLGALRISRSPPPKRSRPARPTGR